MHDVANPDIAGLVARGALFVVNHSGGKDSQASLIAVRRLVPDSQIVLVHAELPGVEWEGLIEHIRQNAGGLSLHVTRARRTMLQMIEERGMFPSPQQRQCTSDLKRGPIERTIRSLSRELGHKLIVNCMGMRAAESASRARLVPFKPNERNSKAGREWYDWLPIHDWPTDRVFAEIAAAGQKPHWAYAAGMTRLSCCFCIMSSRQDLTTAARLNPALYAKYVSLEKRLGVTMMMPTRKDGRRGLEDITGIASLPAEEAA